MTTSSPPRLFEHYPGPYSVDVLLNGIVRLWSPCDSSNPTGIVVCEIKVPDDSKLDAFTDTVNLICRAPSMLDWLQVLDVLFRELREVEIDTARYHEAKRALTNHLLGLPHLIDPDYGPEVHGMDNRFQWKPS